MLSLRALAATIPLLASIAMGAGCSGDGGATANGQPIFTAAASRVVFSSSIDGPIEQDALSTCADEDSITYDVVARTLAYAVCDDSSDHGVETRGTLALSSAENDALVAALGAMAATSDEGLCYEDEGTIEVDITTGSTTSRYLEVDSYCHDNRGIAAAAGVETAESAAYGIIFARDTQGLDGGP